MNEIFTIGIEEEFQIINPGTRELCSRVHSILDEGKLTMGTGLKEESHLSIIETAGGVCGNIKEAEERVARYRGSLVELAKKNGLEIASAGTHPFSDWINQPVSADPLFKDMMDEFGDIARSALVFGLHVHIGIIDREGALQMINGIRPYLPLLLALSANSPFHRGRDTGYKSYRAVVYTRTPRSGIPGYFRNRGEYDELIKILSETGCLAFPGKIWWDARIHPFYSTVEIRICDAQTRSEDTTAMAALIQALAAKLFREYKQGTQFPNIKTAYIEENRWRAARFGIHGKMADFDNKKEISTVETIKNLLGYIEKEAEKLGSTDKLTRIETILKEGTGADGQLRIYSETRDMGKVVEETLVRYVGT